MRKIIGHPSLSYYYFVFILKGERCELGDFFGGGDTF